MLDLKDFVAECQQAVASGDGPAPVAELMRRVVSEPAAIKEAIADMTASGSMTDAMIHRSDALFVLNATLQPYIASPPHDHTMWAVIGIYEGQEDNTVFERRSGTLREKAKRSVRAGEVIPFGPEAIHAISNPLSTPTLGIHVYGGDLVAAQRSMWNPETLEELPYDVPQFFQWCNELTQARRPT